MFAFNTDAAQFNENLEPTLFQIIIEVVRYLLHEMNTVFTSYIVFVPWVNKVIDLNAFVNTLLNEVDTVLPNNNIVVSAMYQQ